MKTRQLFLAVLILVVGSAVTALGEDVKRLANETAEDFAKRNAPASTELTDKVVESDGWNGKKSIFAFYVQSKQDPDVEGYVYIPRSADTYEKIMIGTFEQEGGTPKIEAVFFANADKDGAKELVVLCSWWVKHMDVSGTMYGTYIYDNIATGKHPAKLTFLKSVSEKVSGGCDCEWTDGSKMKANKKFETAAQVKAGLKTLGY